MGYDFYLDKCLLPVPPAELKITQNGMNTTVNLINEGEINLLKTPKLKEISFKFLIPQVSYPFGRYNGSFKEAKYYIEYMERLNGSKKPFQFIVSRALPSGKLLFSTDIKVSMEELIITEAAENGFDLSFQVRLKECHPHRKRRKDRGRRGKGRFLRGRKQAGGYRVRGYSKRKIVRQFLRGGARTDENQLQGEGKLYKPERLTPLSYYDS